MKLPTIIGVEEFRSPPGTQFLYKGKQYEIRLVFDRWVENSEYCRSIESVFVMPINPRTGDMPCYVRLSGTAALTEPGQPYPQDFCAEVAAAIDDMTAQRTDSLVFLGEAQSRVVRRESE